MQLIGNVRVPVSRRAVSLATRLLIAAATLLIVSLLNQAALAQTTDLTVDVLVNSANSTGYNVSSTSPGEYQRYPERYLENLQMPYRVIDVSQTPPPNLAAVPLIIAGHRGLQLSSAWQQAILTAVEGGVGFVNLDWDTAICIYTHMQAMFGCASSAAGTAGTAITLPAAFLPDGATPHYITGMQLRWPIGMPASASGNIVYNFHPDDNGVQGTATATVLLNAQGQPAPGGTVLAQIGNDAFWTITTYGSGHAVYIGTYDYLRADRFGFVMGLDDLFWRSLVWAARKPFAIRGYPRLFASQQDDPVDDWSTRVGDQYNTAFTGTATTQTLINGTKVTIGGPWKVTGNIQDDDADFNNGSQERQNVINAINSGLLKAGPHTNTGGSDGDLFWSGAGNSSPLTDSQWLANFNSMLGFQQGGGPNGSFNGTNDFIPFTSYFIPHFWDFSNNIGDDMWQQGFRYLSEIQQPGAFYDGPCKTPAQRMPGLHPYRVYEQPPTNCNPNEIWPIFWADNYTLGSRAGHPARTFFGFVTQLQGMNYPSFDARWPQAANGIPPATALENWKAYVWRFWSSLDPVQVYNHDGGSMANSTTQERQNHITNVSSWLNGLGVRHMFMEELGAYMHARVNSNLTGGSVTPSTITLNFSGSSTDMNGALVTTETLLFFGNDNGVSIDVPGFANGTSVSIPNVTPPTLQVNVASLSFSAQTGGSDPAPQSISVSNSGTGNVNWTATDNMSWLTIAPSSGTNSGTITASAHISGLGPGTYSGSITVSAAGASNSPQSITVTLTVSSPALGVSPSTININTFQGQGNPAPVPMNISNLGAGTVNWTATVSANTPWLTLSAASGTAPSTINVQTNVSGLGVGNYSGSINVSAPGVLNSPQNIPVTLTLSGLLLSSTGSLQGWANSPLGLAQDWSIVNGTIQNNGGGHTQLYAGDGNWTSYDLKADIKLSSLSDYPGGIRARVNPSSGASYALWLYPNEGIVRLYRTVAWNIDSGFTQLGQASFKYDTTNFHTFEINCSGTTIQALGDGNLLIQATDSTLASGMVALDVSNRIINFENILVTSSTPSSDAISTTPSSLSFATVNGVNPAAQSLQLSSSGGVLAWTASSSASWLTFSTSSGNTGGSINVTANANGLAAGNYNATITVTSLGAQGSPLSIPVTFAVTAAQPVLQSSPASLNFFGSTTSAPAGQNIHVTNGANGAMSWSASADSGWLSTNPSSGNAPTTTTVTANSVGMAVGQYNGNVILSSAQAGNSPLNVPVSLYVGTLLFSDNFSNGAGNWTISPLGNANGWSVVNGFYSYNGQGPTQSYTGSESWTNYSLSADFQLSNTNNYPGGIRARLNLTNGGGYGVWFYPGSGFIRLYSIGQWNIDAGFSTLAQANMSFDTNVHNIRIDVNGSSITVFYDNAQIMHVTDATFSTGGVALDVSSQPIKYTNVRVTSF
jgi:hypothetical protein